MAAAVGHFLLDTLPQLPVVSYVSGYRTIMLLIGTFLTFVVAEIELNFFALFSYFS